MSFNPWSMWTLGMRSAQMAFETFEASARVINHRTPLIQAAARNPLTADHAELGTMVTEKMAAFSQAGIAAMTGMATLQRIWLGALTAGGARAGSGSARMLEQANRSMVQAMTPIHKAATANARRLGRKKKR
jgi:hypothetical protein